MKTLKFTLLALGLLLVLSCSKEDDVGFNESKQLSGIISEETLLKNINLQRDIADYIVTEDLIVESDLHIEPGVRIVFEFGASLIVNETGSIRALGESGKEIVLTGKEEREGYWQGIKIKSLNVMNEINHASIEFAGGDPIEEGDLMAGIHCIGGRLYLKNSTIRNTDGYGMIVDDTSELKEHVQNVYSRNSAGNLMIHPNNINELDDASIYDDDNGRENNILLTGGSTTRPIVFKLLGPDIHFEMTRNVEFTENVVINSGTTIIMHPETRIYIDQFAGFTVNGTANDPVKILGLIDSEPSWKGIVVRSATVENDINYLEISDAGSNKIDPLWLGNAVAAIGLRNNSRLSIKNSSITSIAGCKIFMKDSAFLDHDESISNDDVCH